MGFFSFPRLKHVDVFYYLCDQDDVTELGLFEIILPPLIVGSQISGCFLVVDILALLLQVASVMTMWNQIQPTYAPNLWNEALNMRLGTQVCNRLLVSCDWQPA